MKHNHFHAYSVLILVSLSSHQSRTMQYKTINITYTKRKTYAEDFQGVLTESYNKCSSAQMKMPNKSESRKNFILLLNLRISKKQWLFCQHSQFHNSENTNESRENANISWDADLPIFHLRVVCTKSKLMNIPQ